MLAFAPNPRALLALIALSAGAACGGAPPPKPTEVAAPLDAGVVSPAPEIVDASATVDAPADAAASSSCAVKKASLTRSADDAEHQCLDGAAPRASDVRVTFAPRTPTVSPGGPLVLDVRITNVSDHTLSIRTELPASESLVVTTDKNVTIAPPAGPMPITPNAKCMGMTCSHVTIPRGVVVALLPGGVIEGAVTWQASRVAWPPARPQDCLASCMGTDVMIPIATKPLTPGTYRVQTSLRTWSKPEWIVLPASTDVVVR
ncbi:MAG: hypothetical protein HOO96_06605 [Polyangiaceae bacterium]|nr:hypothetical protein [Polyangiaceae bacterium]